MRHLLIAFALALSFVACSSSGVFVDELSTGSQISLCESFLDDFCAVNPDFCLDDCIDTGCAPAADMGDIDAECVDVLDTEVKDCGIAGDQATCAGGGGCMIDALEAACSGA